VSRALKQLRLDLPMGELKLGRSSGRRRSVGHLPTSQPELGGNPVSLRAPNRPMSGSMAFLGHLGLNTVQKSKGKQAKNPLNGARQ
jgi:hypothetical protein